MKEVLNIYKFLKYGVLVDVISIKLITSRDVKYERNYIRM